MKLQKTPTQICILQISKSLRLKQALSGGGSNAGNSEAAAEAAREEAEAACGLFFGGIFDVFVQVSKVSFYNHPSVYTTALAKPSNPIRPFFSFSPSAHFRVII